MNIKTNKNKLSLLIILSLTFLVCIVLGLRYIALNNTYSLAEVQLLNSGSSSNGEIDMLTVANGFTDEKYIPNAGYFIANPKHADNDGSDNIAGTCTTVAMQLLMGYHNYYSDRRLIPQTDEGSRIFLSQNYGDLLEHPELKPATAGEDDLGREAIGTEDGFYQELMRLNPISGVPGLGQAIGCVASAGNSFVSQYANDIRDEVSISYDVYVKNTAIEEINAGRPIILGYSPASSDGSFHIVTAYGYATYNGEFGYVVHYGWGKAKTKIWVPSSWFGFRIKMSVDHTHNLSDTENNVYYAYRELKCEECGYTTIDSIYEYDLADNAIVGLNYELNGTVTIPLYFKNVIIKKIGNEVFKDSGIREVNSLTIMELIGDSAFENCSDLEVVNINSVLRIGNKAFKNCVSLKEFTLPSNLMDIGYQVFSGCNNLKLYCLWNPNFTLQNDILYNKSKTKMILSHSTAVDLTIPDSVTEISPYAFDSNVKLYTVHFEGAPIIGDYAFSNCTDLMIYFNKFEVPQVGSAVFDGDNIQIYVPYCLQTEFKNVFPQYENKIISKDIHVFLKSGEENVGTIDTYYGDEKKLKAISKTGYEFGGWYDENRNEYTEGGYWESYNSLTLDVEWIPKQYTITFRTKIGTLVGSNTLVVEYGKTFSTTTYAVKEGYTFEGWKDIDEKKLIIANGESLDVWNHDGNLLLYADMSVKSYEIQINDNGTITWLSKDGISFSQCEIEYGTVISSINLIKVFKESAHGFKEGHIFDHFEFGGAELDWKIIPDLGESGSIVTIFPVWVLEKHTISFDPQCEMTVDDIRLEYGQAIELPKPSRTGYTLNGWYTSTDDSATKIAWVRMPDLSPESQENASIKLYAKWTQITYYVHYNPNGGVGSMSDTVFQYDQSKNLSLNTFTKTGHDFKGWSTSPNGGVKYSNEQNVQNLTSVQGKYFDLYAVWEAKTYSIIYKNLTSDMYVYPDTYTYGVGMSSMPKLYLIIGSRLEEVKKFYGWYTSLSFINKFNYISTTDIGDITVYAKYDYFVDTTYGSGINTVTDGKLENQPSYSVDLMLGSVLYKKVKSTTLNKIEITISLDLWEVNDGYQDFYLYNGNEIVWEKTIEHGAWKKNTQASHYEFKIELSLARYCDVDFMDLIFHAHGVGADDWKFTNFQMSIYFTN